MSVFTRTNTKILNPKASSEEGFLESMMRRLYIQRFPLADPNTEGDSSKNSRLGSKTKDKKSPRQK